jgi:branched-chain amino acid transport system permease protein
VPAAILVTAVLGFVIGVPSLRLEGPYLAIATLGFGLAIQQILNNWSLVGASSGTLVNRPVILGFDFYGDKLYYYLVLALTIGCTWMIFNLERSHIGRALHAVRDADLAAQMSGIGLARYKSLAFVLSAGIAGLAGALYGPLVGYITPESFNLLLSIKFLLMIVVGGLGYLPGALVGAAFITGLEVYLSTFRAWSQLVFGAVVILIMVAEPAGLYGRWLKVRRYWKTWPM